eukprot:Amastigsp_a4144_23.p5 type:complete len:102 gc:universal Amastigsp_a4144_23:1108-1413(+)
MGAMNMIRSLCPFASKPIRSVCPAASSSAAFFFLAAGSGGGAARRTAAIVRVALRSRCRSASRCSDTSQITSPPITTKSVLILSLSPRSTVAEPSSPSIPS